jgi:hypothetical protein
VLNYSINSIRNQEHELITWNENGGDMEQASTQSEPIVRARFEIVYEDGPNRIGHFFDRNNHPLLDLDVDTLELARASLIRLGEVSGYTVEETRLVLADILGAGLPSVTDLATHPWAQLGIKTTQSSDDDIPLPHANVLAFGFRRIVFSQTAAIKAAEWIHERGYITDQELEQLKTEAVAITTLNVPIRSADILTQWSADYNRRRQQSRFIPLFVVRAPSDDDEEIASGEDFDTRFGKVPEC